MLENITYGTYIIFGLLTYLGAAFVWFVVVSCPCLPTYF